MGGTVQVRLGVCNFAFFGTCFCRFSEQPCDSMPTAPAVGVALGRGEVALRLTLLAPERRRAWPMTNHGLRPIVPCAHNHAVRCRVMVRSAAPSHFPPSVS